MDKQTAELLKQNKAVARTRIGKLGRDSVQALAALTGEYRFAVALGDLILLGRKWYVTHTGLIRLARRSRCFAIHVRPVREYCDAHLARWVFKASVYKSRGSKAFVGYGDADPSNVSPLVQGAEMRVAETRAVNRALRKAYGIGLCSVEELGWTPRQPQPERPTASRPVQSINGHNGHHNEPRLRDRLCLLIRQHHLDASLVKAYAADYCGSPVLRDASRESVEAFINHLTEEAANDRDSLLCRLNSYAKTEEAHP